MRSVYLTQEQFQYLLEILESAKAHANEWAYEYATTPEQYKETKAYEKGLDAVIALLEQAVTNNPPSLQE